jgi:hypothetical protein
MSSGKVFFTMKNLYKISVVLFVLLNFSCAIQNPVSAQPGYVNNQVFYDQLSPYGQWIDNPDYGYVWIPDVDQDFSPYSTSGYWVMTDDGWTWVSDYPWGWAAFHYGRWDYNNNYGWFWLPDNEWGPSWVTWRTGNGYYGWTPMRPGMSISLSFGNEYRDLDHWNFVRESDFGRSDINHYYANKNDYNRIIVNSTVINNTYTDRNRNSTYISGPSRSEVQRVTGRKISNITITDNDKPGQTLNRSQLKIYRPQIQKNNDLRQKPAPTKITNLKDVRPARERITPDQRSKVSPVETNPQKQQQSQPQRQTEKQNQEQQKKQQQQAQPQKQIERQNQQQLPNQQKQEQQQKQQVEKQNQEKQRQVQQQQQQEKKNQDQQIKQQKDQQRQVQQQQLQQQKQERRNQAQQVKQQKVQQRQVQRQTKQEQKQTRKNQEQK